MIIRTVSAVSALALASVTGAQIPVPEHPPECGGVLIEDVSRPLNTNVPQIPMKRSFIIQDDGFCSEYVSPGWEEPMQLYLGEGSSEYFSLLEEAVKLWNDALIGFSRTPVISIVEGVAPKTFRLPSDFWADPNSRDYLYDDQSVIYFKGGDTSDTISSFAHYRWDGNAMQEADIYINITHEEEYGRDLGYASAIFETDEEYSAYAIVNSTYVTLLHEIGHALGLGHIPVSGNIMSYNYAPGLAEIWEPAAISILLTSYAVESLRSALSLGSIKPDVSDFPLFFRSNEISPYMVVHDENMLTLMGLFNKTARLGEQDKMALLCSYAFKDWNH